MNSAVISEFSNSTDGITLGEPLDLRCFLGLSRHPSGETTLLPHPARAVAMEHGWRAPFGGTPRAALPLERGCYGCFPRIGRRPGRVWLEVQRLGDGSVPECAKVEWLTERDAV